MSSIKIIREILLANRIQQLFILPVDAKLEEISRAALSTLYSTYKANCVAKPEAWNISDPNRDIHERLGAARWALRLQPYISTRLIRGVRTLTACQEITRWSESFNINSSLDNLIHGAWLKLIDEVLFKGAGDESVTLLSSLKDQIATIFGSSAPLYIQNMLALTNNVLVADTPENQTLQKLSEMLREYLDPGEIVRMLSWIIANKNIRAGRYEKMTNKTAGLPRTATVLMRDQKVSMPNENKKHFMIHLKRKVYTRRIKTKCKGYDRGSNAEIKPVLRITCSSSGNIEDLEFCVEYVSVDKSHKQKTTYNADFYHSMAAAFATRSKIEKHCPGVTAGIDAIFIDDKSYRRYYFSFVLLHNLANLLDCRNTTHKDLPRFINPIIRGILNGLTQLHLQGWAFGDIKANNLLYRIKGSEVKVYFTDFDTANHTDHEQTKFLLTPRLIPPRFFIGAKGPQYCRNYSKLVAQQNGLYSAFKDNTINHRALIRNEANQYLSDHTTTSLHKQWTQKDDVFNAGGVIIELYQSVNLQPNEKQLRILLRMIELIEKDRCTAKDAAEAYEPIPLSA